MYLVALPVIIIAVVVKIVSDRYKLEILSKIAQIVIILCVLFFAHFYAVSKGFNIIDIAIKFFTL